MADQKYDIEVTDKVASTIEPKIRAIGTASRDSFTALQQLQTMLRGINGSALNQLQNQLAASANAMRQLTQAQTNLNTANAQAQLILQRVATEAARTQTQLQNLTTATIRTATESARLATEQQRTAAAALNAAAAAGNLATAQNNAATAAQRLATEQARTAAAITQGNTATINQGRASTQAATAQQRLAEAQSRAQRAATDATTAQQRLATEQQRTAAATSNAAAAADRARIAAIQLQQAQQQLAGSVNRSTLSLLDYAKAAALAFGAAIGADSILKTADAYTIMQNKLSNLAETQADVNLLTQKMFELSLETGQAVTNTTGAFQKFDNAMMQLGGSQAETLRLIETLNKATVVSGATTSEAAAGILQLGQAFGSGRLQGDEFRSIMENLPVVADLIAKSMGKTRGELKELSTQGKLTAEVLRKAFAEGAAGIDEKFGKTVFTLAQQFTNFNTKFTEWVGELNKSIGLTSAVGSVIKVLGNNLNAVAATLAIVSSLLLVAFGPTLVTMLGAATVALKGFTLALATNPIGLLIVGITTAVSLIAAFGDQISLTSDKFTTLKDMGIAALSFISDGFGATIDFIKSVWNSGIDWLNSKTGGFAEKFRDIFGVIVAQSKTNTNFLIAVFVGAVDAIARYWSLYPQLMQSIFAQVVNFGAAAVETLVNGWQLGLRGIAKLAESVAPDISKSLNSALDSVSLELPRMEVKNSVIDMAADIGNEFSKAFGKDYVGQAADAFMLRAQTIAAQRAGALADGGLRGEGVNNIAAKVDPKAAKLAEKRAMTLAKINGELDKQLNTMFTLNPQRQIDQQFDEIQIQLASKKIKLNESETASLRSKLTEINNNKQLQQAYDSVYEDSIKTLRDYNNTMDASDMLYARGAISLIDYQTAINKASESYANSVNPLREFNIGVQDQLKLLQIVGPAQDIERQIMQKQNEMRAQGKTLTDEQTESIRQQLTAVQLQTTANDLLNGYYNDSIGKQEQLTAKSLALAQAHERGYVSAEQYAIGLRQISVDTAALQMQMGNATMFDAATVALGSFVSNYQGVLSGLGTAWGDFFTGFTDGFADSVGRAIVMGDSLSDSLRNVAQQVLTSLISALVKLGVQYAINAALGTSLGATALATQTAASVTAAGATAAAWATPAALVSLASFGANSVPASAGITATVALSEGMALLSAIPGFATGGYTGNMGVGQVAGVVHGQEFVMNADATARNRDLLESLNSGRSASSATRSSSTNSGGVSGITVIVENHGTDINVEQIDENTIRIIARQEAETAVRDGASSVVAADLRNANSPVSKSLSASTNVTRKRG